MAEQELKNTKIPMPEKQKEEGDQISQPPPVHAENPTPTRDPELLEEDERISVEDVKRAEKRERKAS